MIQRLRHLLGLYTAQEVANATTASLHQARAIGQQEGYAARQQEGQRQQPDLGSIFGHAFVEGQHASAPWQ
jgi:hypothetical protein